MLNTSFLSYVSTSTCQTSAQIWQPKRTILIQCQLQEYFQIYKSRLFVTTIWLITGQFFLHVIWKGRVGSLQRATCNMQESVPRKLYSWLLGSLALVPTWGRLALETTSLLRRFRVDCRWLRISWFSTFSPNYKATSNFEKVAIIIIISSKAQQDSLLCSQALRLQLSQRFRLCQQ